MISKEHQRDFLSNLNEFKLAETDEIHSQSWKKPAEETLKPLAIRFANSCITIPRGLEKGLK